MKEPAPTCPKVDKVKQRLKDILWNYDKAIDYLQDLKKETEDALDELEEVRDANIELREWGSHWHEVAQEAESAA